MQDSTALQDIFCTRFPKLMDLCEKWGNIGFDSNCISYQNQIDNVK